MASMSCNWNESNIKQLAISYWRASLVPAAAVIPAPTVYVKVVSVKKLVVGFELGMKGLLYWLVSYSN